MVISCVAAIGLAHAVTSQNAAELNANDNIIKHETTKSTGYSCKYFDVRNGYYGYASQNNNVYYFKPEINKKNYILVSKTNVSGLGGLYFVSSMSEISCKNRCRVLKIGKYSKNDLSLSGMLLPAHDAKYKVMDSNTIYGSAMGDLMHGCMASTVNKEEISARTKEVHRLAKIFAQKIMTKISNAWGRNYSAALSCELQVQLSPQGRLIVQPHILQSSGDKRFDQSAVGAVESAAPFSPPIGLPYSFYKYINVKLSAKDLNR